MILGTCWTTFVFISMLKRQKSLFIGENGNVSLEFKELVPSQKLTLPFSIRVRAVSFSYSPSWFVCFDSWLLSFSYYAIWFVCTISWTLGYSQTRCRDAGDKLSNLFLVKSNKYPGQTPSPIILCRCPKYQGLFWFGRKWLFYLTRIYCVSPNLTSGGLLPVWPPADELVFPTLATKYQQMVARFSHFLLKQENTGSMEYNSYIGL